MLSIVAADGKAPDDYQPWSEHVMCGKEPAPHEWQSLTLRFRPQPSEAAGPRPPYMICARAGGGGGHSLTVEELCVRELAAV